MVPKGVDMTTFRHGDRGQLVVDVPRNELRKSLLTRHHRFRKALDLANDGMYFVLSSPKSGKKKKQKRIFAKGRVIDPSRFIVESPTGRPADMEDVVVRYFGAPKKVTLRELQA